MRGGLGCDGEMQWAKRLVGAATLGGLAWVGVACEGRERSGTTAAVTATSGASTTSTATQATSASTSATTSAMATSTTSATPAPTASATTSASAAASARSAFDGPCAEPRMILAVRKPAEAPDEVALALGAVGRAVGAKLTDEAPRARGEVRIETAAWSGRAFEGVDSNRVVVMAVCADRDTCLAVAEELRRGDAECRCEAVCALPENVSSKPLPARGAARAR